MTRPSLTPRRSALLAVALGSALVAFPAQGAGDTVSQPISTVAGTGKSGFFGESVLGETATLTEPGDVALADDGSLLIADTKNHRIRRRSPSGVIQTVAGTGVAGYGGDGGSATLATLREPSGVAALAGGAFLIADRENHRIRLVSAAGQISTVAGDGSGDDGGDGGAATLASLKKPEDVAPMPGGGFLIADTGNDRIRRVDPSGRITTVAGGDSDDSSGDGGSTPATQLDEPMGIAAETGGGFLIADTGNDRIRRVDPSGRVATVAGGGSSGFSGDGGVATAARLDQPGDVLAVSGGFIIADSANHRVRQVSSTGVIQTLAGNGSAGYNGDGIPATSASLNRPLGVALSPAAVLYVADALNHRIRAVATATSPVDKVEDPKAGGRHNGGPTADLSPPAPPIAGRRLNVSPVKGRVRIKTPGARRFERLDGPGSIPVGSVIDTTSGVVRLASAANLKGKVQQAIFYSGTFAVSQRRAERPVTQLNLRGGSFSSCRRISDAHAGVPATASRRRARRGLWGSGHGRFRTRGRRGAATVRGTIWFTQDRCDGTLVRVKRGVVAVDDFARRRRVLVAAGKSYLAGPRKSRGGARR